MSPELILKNGRILDPSLDIDRIGDVGFSEGKVVAVDETLQAGPSTTVVDVSGKIVSPGFIDLHTHVYWGGTSLGVDAENLMRTSGVTTFVDTGSAGPGNFPGFRKHVIEPSEARILAYLHISFAGIFGFSNTVMVGESADMALMAPAEARDVIDDNRDVIVGVKVRVGRHASGDQGVAPLDIALELAEDTGMPVMAHIDHPPPSYEEIVDRLRPGDVLTHCFRPFPNTPVNGQGAIKDCVIEARKRGVVFDVGHGKGSFAFKTGRAMLDGGFLPDTISSDIHTLCIDGPVYDQAVTLSKFLCLGMSLDDVIRTTTWNAAQALRRDNLGTFRSGAVGDATVFTVEQGEFGYEDSTGDRLVGDKRLISHGVVMGGQWRPA